MLHGVGIKPHPNPSPKERGFEEENLAKRLEKLRSSINGYLDGVLH